MLSGDLILALSGQDEQLENAFVRIEHRTGAAPHRPQLSFGQDTLTHHASCDQPPRFKVAERRLSNLVFIRWSLPVEQVAQIRNGVMGQSLVSRGQRWTGSPARPSPAGR